jgi:conjugal transfer/entry exclusion protein
MAQGYPVLDIANLMQAINTLYATYDQITATIEQVQNTYQQLQKQIEMVQNMDFGIISGRR